MGEPWKDTEKNRPKDEGDEPKTNTKKDLETRSKMAKKCTGDLVTHRLPGIARLRQIGFGGSSSIGRPTFQDSAYSVVIVHIRVAGADLINGGGAS